MVYKLIHRYQVQFYHKLFFILYILVTICMCILTDTSYNTLKSKLWERTGFWVDLMELKTFLQS